MRASLRAGGLALVVSSVFVISQNLADFANSESLNSCNFLATVQMTISAETWTHNELFQSKTYKFPSKLQKILLSRRFLFKNDQILKTRYNFLIFFGKPWWMIESSFYTQGPHSQSKTFQLPSKLQKILLSHRFFLIKKDLEKIEK